MDFPADYIEFLGTHGWAKIRHDWIFGLGLGVPTFANVVSVTINEREVTESGMLGHLVPIMNDGAGNHSCLDCHGGDAGYSPIVFWDHESQDGSGQVPDIVADSIASWLLARARSQPESSGN